MFIHCDRETFVSKRAIYTLLKFLEWEEVTYDILEVYKGIEGKHLGIQALAKKFLKAGCYWSSMVQDTKEYVTKYDQCQRHGEFIVPHLQKCICWHVLRHFINGDSTSSAPFLQPHVNLNI